MVGIIYHRTTVMAVGLVVVAVGPITDTMITHGVIVISKPSNVWLKCFAIDRRNHFSLSMVLATYRNC